MNKTDEWVKTCLRKKKLREDWADSIIKRAEIPLWKYYCPHCFHWHITSKPLDNEPKKRRTDKSITKSK